MDLNRAAKGDVSKRDIKSKNVISYSISNLMDSLDFLLLILGHIDIALISSIVHCSVTAYVSWGIIQGLEESKPNNEL